MGFFRALFLGVYASNSTIRILYFPLIYLILSSPFIAIILFYLDIRLPLPASLTRQHFTPAELLLQVFVSILAFTLPTRLISGRTWKNENDGRPRRIQQAPFWIPSLRNLGSVICRGNAWLKGVRDSSITTVVTYSTANRKHVLIFTPDLLDQVRKLKASHERAEVTKRTILRNAFNLPASTPPQYQELERRFSAAFKQHVFSGNGLEAVLSTFLTTLSDTMPDLVTFNASLVDQLPWERVAGIELRDGTAAADCDFHALINEFFCTAIITAITGPQFVESYQLLASDLASFTAFYFPLALGLPRLFPLAGLPGAVLAKKRLLTNFDRLFEELTNAPAKKMPTDDESESDEETDADSPTPLSAINGLFTQHEIPTTARTSIFLQFLNDVTSELVPLACWTLLHMLQSSASASAAGDPADPGPLITTIREEVKIWVQGIQPPSIHPSFPAPPEIEYNGTARPLSSTSFTHLRSCINEARRLYKNPITTYEATEPIVLTEHFGGVVRADTPPEKWQIEAGSYLDIGLSQSLINTSPAHFSAPSEFKPDRFLHSPPPSSILYSENDNGTSSPGDQFSTAFLLAFLAGLLQLWDIAPAPEKSFLDHLHEMQAAAAGPAGVEPLASSRAEETSAGDKKRGTWVIPRAVDGAGVMVPGREVRVRIRRREGLVERRVLRKGR